MQFIIIVSILLVSLSVHAGIYRWVDEDGAVHFGDKPVNKSSAEKIEIKTNAVSNDQTQRNRLRQQQRLLSVMDEERKIKKQKQAEEKEEKEKIAANCKEAEKTLNDYLHHGLLYDLDKSGNKMYLSDQQREEEIKKVRESVEYWCKK